MGSGRAALGRAAEPRDQDIAFPAAPCRGSRAFPPRPRRQPCLGGSVQVLAISCLWSGAAL